MPLSLLSGACWCWMCQDSSMQRVWVWGCASITVAFEKLTCGHMKTHAPQEQRPQGLHSSGPSGVPKGRHPGICLFGRRRCWDIGHKGCCTPLPSFGLLELGPSGDQGQLLSLHDSTAGASAPEGPSSDGREWCTASLLPNFPIPTLAKQADPWMFAFGNTAGP